MSAASLPRLAPVPREELGDDARAALRSAYSDAVVERLLSTEPDAAPLPTVLGTLLHHPALAGPFLAYNNMLLSEPALGHRRRELLVLRVAWLTRSRYEWAQHVRMAGRYGITPEEIEAVTTGASAPHWPPVEAALLVAADQLVEHYAMDDDTWRLLAQHLDERQLVEVVFVVGTYAALAMAFNSFRLQLDPELADVEMTSATRFEE